MSSRVKSYLVIACSVLAGAIIGILGTSAWQHHRNVSLTETRLHGGLFRHIDRIIEIHDETQRSEIQAALLRAERSFYRHRRQMVDSLAFDQQILIDDLQRILRTDQWEEVKTWLERGRKHGIRTRGRQRARPARLRMSRDSSHHLNKSLE